MSIDRTTPVSELAEKFARKFGAEPLIVQAPGRVNLIGEHTDYNDGFVLPAAIQFHTSVAIAPRNDHTLVVASENYGDQKEFGAQQLPTQITHHWSDYVIGVARELTALNIQLPAASLFIQGGVPQGAGLSSSASLEVAACRAFLALTSSTLDGIELAKLCQRAENNFVGARCGIMDQFIAVHGKKNHALLLDCRTLGYQYQPLPPGVRLVICNTMVRHSVAGGEYNQRRKECEQAAVFFATKKPGAVALRDISTDAFIRYEKELPEIVQRRSRHVITENERVLQAGEALRRNDLSRFGQLMSESHRSLRDDYEVSCPELDLMVELAAKMRGVYGARMTGGGFGGCTINLVQEEHVETFRTRVAEEYERATGKRPEIYVCSAADGVHQVA